MAVASLDSHCSASGGSSPHSLGTARRAAASLHSRRSIQPHGLGGGAAGGVVGRPEAGEEGGDGDEGEGLEEDRWFQDHADTPAEELAVDDEDEQGGEHQATEGAEDV